VTTHPNDRESPVLEGQGGTGDSKPPRYRSSSSRATAGGAGSEDDLGRLGSCLAAVRTSGRRRVEPRPGHAEAWRRQAEDALVSGRATLHKETVKMKRTIRVPSVLLASALVLCAPLVARAEASRATPGFNLFSVEQDVEIGRQSAVEAERQLPMLNDRNVDRYLNKIVEKLAAQAPGARYPYTIKAVNASEINAF
jgi:hypothetical protein